MALDDRVRAERRSSRNAAIAIRVAHTSAGRIELEAVVTAANAITAAEFAEAQRRKAVRTHAGDGRCRSVFAAKKDDRLFKRDTFG